MQWTACNPTTNKRLVSAHSFAQVTAVISQQQCLLEPMQKPHSMFLHSVVQKNLLCCILCCTEIFTLTFNANLRKLPHTKFSSAILSNNFSTSLESIILGHENDEKIWILLLVVQCCTGWLGMMSHVVSPTDMLQSVVTHPAFQLAPDSSS